MKTKFQRFISRNTCIPLSLSIGCAALVSVNAATDVWNNSTSLWETGSAWTPAGPPTAADIASFDPTVVSTDGIVRNPTINSAGDVAASLFLANNFLGGTYSFGGTGTLTLGAAVTTRGFGTTTINGPALTGTGAATLTFNVGTSSGLTLTGTTVATTTGTLNLNGGTFTLDNSASTTAHLVGATPVSLVGGTLSVLGNSAGTSYTFGAASFNAGFNTVSVTPGGPTAGTTATFTNTGSLRTQTYMVEQYVATSGSLGAANGPRVTFTGTPFLGSNGLLANTTGGGTVGFATVRDAGGTNFATYVTPTATAGGIVAATATKTVTDASGLATLAATDVGQFNPAAAATVTASGPVTSGTLRITPAGGGSTLAMGASQLGTLALMLDGANDFAISGTGLYGGTVSGTRYVYVNNAATTLTTSLVIANGGNPTNIAGPGFVVLNGTANQNTLTTTNRLTLMGGVLRGNNTQLGFGATGGPGFINFRGGVLEIANGANGTGASADYTRPLATTATAGATNWASSATDQGSGGFSAFGSNASVNLGGSATPAGVTWNAGGFVGDGYALRFGSTKSNAILTFLNPIALDGGVAGTYAAREINVAAGAGGDKTMLAGVITGSASTGLIKTGAGRLDLTAANAFSGGTFVQQGTLVAAAGSGSALGGTSSVSIVSGTLLLGASNQINNSANLTLGGGTFDLGGFSEGAAGTTGLGSLILSATSAIDYGTLGAGTSLLQFGGVGAHTASTILNVTDYDIGTDHLYFSGNVSDFTTAYPNQADVTFDGASGYATVQNGGYYEVYALVPVPEPATIFGGAALLGLVAYRERRRVSRLLQKA